MNYAYKIDDEELWAWYLHVCACRKSGLARHQYAKIHGLDKKKFANMEYRINFLKFRDNNKYQSYLLIHKEWKESGLTKQKFAKANRMLPSQLTTITCHLSAITKIEELKALKGISDNSEESSPMKFIKIPSKTPEPAKKEIVYSESPPEILEKQNDIEIHISKGVKVMISPNVDSIKIIKIIELLKDL